MMSLRKYTGNVFRFGEVVLANYGDRQVSIVGVNGTQDHLVIGGFQGDFLVPTRELDIPENQRTVLNAQLAKAQGAIGGPSRQTES